MVGSVTSQETELPKKETLFSLKPGEFNETWDSASPLYDGKYSKIMILIPNLLLRCILLRNLFNLSVIYLFVCVFIFFFKKINKSCSKWSSGSLLLIIGWAQTALWIPPQSLASLQVPSQCPSIRADCDQLSQPVSQQQSSKGTSRRRIACQAVLLEHAHGILIGIFPKKLLVHTHFIERCFLCGCVFIRLRAQPRVCSVDVTCFALSAGSFSYFFSGNMLW